jgi:hypothetical protein
VDTIRGFHLEHGWDMDMREASLDALGYAVGTVVLSFKSDKVGRLLFDTALTQAIVKIRGYQMIKERISQWTGPIGMPGIYAGMPIETYHSAEAAIEPSVSSSGLRTNPCSQQPRKADMTKTAKGRSA